VESFRIESIADHLDLVPTVAGWHWTEWGHTDPEGSLVKWTDGLGRRTCRNAIPTTYVALADASPVGSVTLIDHDMAIHLDLSPWLAGLYVLPQHRGKGVGSALVICAEKHAMAMPLPRLYLYTARAERLYQRLGWETIAQDRYQSQDVYVMVKDLTVDH